MAELAWNIVRSDGWWGVLHGFKRLVRVDSGNPLVSVFLGGGNDYTGWLRRFDTLTEADRIRLRVQVQAMALKPLLSVVMPTYNTPLHWLDEAIESVRRQLYPHWEFCISDDASTDPAVRTALERWQEIDPRIRVVFRPQNGHICASTNSALELVQGEWVVLLDHDDLLPEHALFWVAHTINAQPDAQMIYSDEEKISEKGVRRYPYFKPDWNPDLFLSQNMFSHLGAYRTALVRQVGGFQQGYEGAQDYDLALRCMEQVRSEQIVHIPRVLYSWRVHEASTASTNAAKPYAAVAGERALNGHLTRTGVVGETEFTGHGYRVRYAPAPTHLRVGVVILGGTLSDWQRCMEGLRLQKVRNPLDVVVVCASVEMADAQLNWAKQARLQLLPQGVKLRFSG